MEFCLLKNMLESFLARNIHVDKTKIYLLYNINDTNRSPCNDDRIFSQMSAVLTAYMRVFSLQSYIHIRQKTAEKSYC